MVKSVGYIILLLLLLGGVLSPVGGSQKQVFEGVAQASQSNPGLLSRSEALALSGAINDMSDSERVIYLADVAENNIERVYQVENVLTKLVKDAKSVDHTSDFTEFFEALENVRSLKRFSHMFTHIEELRDLWQDVEKLDLFISDLASNENLLDLFLDAADDATRLKYAGAWESIASDISVRINDLNINKIDNQVSINNTQLDRIKESFDASPNKQQYVDELQPKQTYHDNAADNVNGPISETQDQIDELLVTNNPINNTSKKFWWNHESNVNLHLDNIYGGGNVGRQITVDITTTTETFTVRLDNIIDEVGGKVNFKIGDAKSSINNNLSSKTAEQLRNTMSTTNQMKLYDALENGTIIQAKPRGERARQFFDDVQSNDDLYPINLSKNIDFYVNDSPASAGYNIYKKTLEL